MKTTKHPIDKLSKSLIEQIKQKDLDHNNGQEEIWAQIKAEINHKENHKETPKMRLKLAWRWAGIAASILLLIGTTIYISYQSQLSQFDKSIVQISKLNTEHNDIQLIVSKKETIKLKNDDASVVYTPSGDIIVNTNDSNVEEVISDKLSHNQLIIPKGKFIKLQLSDGTILHVNSGSKVVYPPIFNSNLREIYVDGEVFLEVAKNKKKPFIVHTSKFEVEVLGTSFNINAYKNDEKATVVLVSGTVEVNGENNKKSLLKPNEMVSLNNGEVQTIRSVNTDQYTSWTKGYLIFEKESLRETLESLQGFYGTRFKIDPKVENFTFSGKLDIKQPLSQLIELISFTAPIQYHLEDNVYYVKSK